MRSDLPELARRRTPFRLKFGCLIDLRRDLDYSLRLIQRLPSRLTGDPLESPLPLHYRCAPSPVKP
jgi:hypothetical protein